MADDDDVAMREADAGLGADDEHDGARAGAPARPSRPGCAASWRKILHGRVHLSLDMHMGGSARSAWRMAAGHPADGRPARALSSSGDDRPFGRKASSRDRS